MVQLFEDGAEFFDSWSPKELHMVTNELCRKMPGRDYSSSSNSIEKIRRAVSTLRTNLLADALNPIESWSLRYCRVCIDLRFSLPAVARHHTANL